MTSLSEKRYIARLNKSKHEDRDAINMENVNLNTDELETKLDSIIINTNQNEYSSSHTTVIPASGSFTTASTDFGAVTDRHKIHTLGNLTSNLVNISMELSHDNVTFYKDHAFNFTILGNSFSCLGQTNFRYFRLKVVDLSGSSNTLNMEIVAKNI